MRDKIMKLRQQHIGKLQDQAGHCAFFCQRVQTAGRYQNNLVFREGIRLVAQCHSHVVGQGSHYFHVTVPVCREMGIVVPI